MDDYVTQLSEAANDLEKRPVWDKLGEMEPKAPSEPDRYSSDSKPDRSVLWQTTNAEYGRFQKIPKAEEQWGAAGFSFLPNEDGTNGPREYLDSRCGSTGDPGASARSRTDDVAEQEDMKESREDGTPLGGYYDKSYLINKYMPIQDSGCAPPVPSEERRRLTTGFAKSYMRQSHAPLWNNLQTVADGAGLDSPGSAANSRPDTQVLKVEYEGQGQDNYDIDDVDAFLAGLHSDGQQHTD